MKKFIKFDQAPVILRITGSGIPPPYLHLILPRKQSRQWGPPHSHSALFQLKNGFDQFLGGKPAIAKHVIRNKTMLHRPSDQGDGIGDFIDKHLLGSFTTRGSFSARFGKTLIQLPFQ